ncbi:hypothetical protein DL89DRAFT_320330 [Linderina pennispora]|uniref:CST complex subunit CTC1 n=1 Tax=Linderina pennispora TaxID=61395 RepID=A0A1Y1WN78_9FUNG|nr:uncharacterized protein DL89DRAFT_320330 [Linderina pennispora]ORX74922.1 hypothetical protein DL89DRAFT_320330 [Linderina pennispora]
MGPSAVVDIRRLDDVRRQQALSKDGFVGGALLGKLRVASRTEQLATEPFHLPAGSIVLVDSCGAQIRCCAVDPHPSWFADHVYVLLTRWRYIPPPRQLSGRERLAWAYIEILADPVLVPSQMDMPKNKQPYSWWTAQQAPVPDTTDQIQSAIRVSPPISATRGAHILQQAQRSPSPDPTHHHSHAVYGRVDAMGSLLVTASEDVGFFVCIAVESSAMDPISSFSVLLVGARFLGLFASLRAGDSLFVDHLRARAPFAESDHSQAIFITSLDSQAFRIEDSVAFVWGDQQPSSQRSSHFTQSSQNMLLEQIADSSQRTDTSQAPGNWASRPERVPAGPPLNTWRDPHLFVNQGKLESYAGVVTRIVDLVLGIYVVDDCHMLILTYWPLLSPLTVLRTGTRILVENSHIILLSNSAGYQWEWIKRALPGDTAEPSKQRLLVFGACARTSVRVTDFSGTGNSAAMATAIDSEMASLLARNAQGLVQMIETAEAFWKLSKKFPRGMVAGYDPQADGKLIRRELLDSAMRWAGVPTVAGAPATSRNLYAEFLAHDASCRAETPRSHFPTRIVALSDVASRFIKWSRENLSSLPLASAASDEDMPEFSVSHVSPEDLQQTTTALVGRLTLDTRGSLYLADATARIRVHPDASCIGDTHRVLFPGQALIGHVAAWMHWQFSVERIAKHGVNPFDLVYAAASSPVLLHFDTSFGHAISSDPLLSSAECLLVVVHARGNAAPVNRTRHAGPEGAKVTEAADSQRSMGYTAKGIAVPVTKQDAQAVLASLGGEVDEPFDLGDIPAASVRRCLLMVDFKRQSVLLAPGSAYLICIKSTASLQYVRSGDSSQHEQVLLITLGSADSAIPVQAEFRASGSPADLPWQTVSVVPFIVDVSTQPVHLPAVQCNVTTDAAAALSLISGPKVYSVAEVLQAKDGCSPNSLITVRGTVVDRSVSDIVFLEPLLPEPNTVADSASPRPVSGVFSNRITLCDEDSPEQSIPVYLKLASFSHPLAVVQGARFVVHDLIVSVSQTRKSIYLSGTLSTFAQAIVPPLQQADLSGTPSSGGERPSQSTTPARRWCIGDLHMSSAADRAYPVELICQITKIEHVAISVACRKCKQRVCAMRCSCPSKRHRLSSSASGQTIACITEACCWATDGSGISCLVLSRRCDVALMLGMTDQDFDGICCSAAQSWNGQLMWNPQSEHSPITAAASRAVASSRRLRVVGWAEAAPNGPQAIRQQPLRLNRQNVLVNQRTPPRISVRSVSNINTLDMCSRLLKDLYSS